ncbi:MATE family efflux transporter [Flammeovirga agarivorans]|uniref:Multidrug-efflux transporter n=1 Tax=Flammeovirga agarivorans TaxID=2726742 RepID=A0A7X8SIG8_9BACT|nr:MATE family efflux transporter [Flammeovirga agarivorans]NLR90851.1 MATE family efflux transporter [Flammeovirga agarivorans]
MRKILNKYSAHYQDTLKIALPVVISQIGQNLTNILDNVMVGHYDTVSLAGAGFANSLFAIFLVFGIGFAVGVTPLVGKAHGQKNYKEMGSLFKNSIVVNAIFTLVILSVLLGLTTMMDFMGQPPEVVQVARPYLLINTFSLIPMMVFFTAKQFAEGVKYTKAAMYFTLIANIVNVVINYILIYGNFGAPEMGLLGAGIGTFVSRLVIGIGMMMYVFRNKSFQLFLSGFAEAKVKSSKLIEQLKMSLPIGLQSLMEVGAFGVGSMIIGTVGTNPMAAHQIVMSMISLTFMMVSGVASAVAVRVSNFYGQDDWEEARNAGFTGLVFAMFAMAISAITFASFNHFLPSLYTSDPEVIKFAASMLLFAALFQLSDGAQVIMTGALRGISEVKMPTLICFISYWVVALPMGYILTTSTDWSFLGVWIGLTSGLTLSAGLLFARFTWKTKHEIERRIEIKREVVNA